MLFVGAHCDDIELFAGGLLAQCCFDDAEVGVLVFSAHEGVLSKSLAAQAHQEFRDNLAWLAAQCGREIVDHSGELLPACQGEFERQRARIYTALEALRDRYDLVVTHDEHDTNQDHRQVALEARRVIKSHATLLGGEFPNNDLGESRRDVYIAISEAALDAKVRMIAQYRSQQFGGRPYFDEAVIRGLARVRGAQIREPAAEAFSTTGRVIVRGATHSS
jgi:LmbE family N-acetylglucosaminyl deacetylase